MSRKLIAILTVTLALTLFSAEKYAVLIAGDYNPTNVPADQLWNEGQGDYSEFWNDLYLQWEMLYQKGYAKENITVIFANGRDMWWDDRDIATRYRAANVIPENPLETITNYSATIDNLDIAVSALRDKIGPDDFLYVWTMSHGGTSTQSGLYFNDGLMTDIEFAGLFNTITANKKVFVINANYAGGFLTALQAENSFIQVSSTGTKSFRADDKLKDGTLIPFLENEEINGNVYYHGESSFHDYCASTGFTPQGLDNYNGIQLSGAEENGDRLISVLESYNWCLNYSSTVDMIAAQDNFNFGSHTCLKYPTILRCPIEGGWGANIYGLSGVIGMTDDINVEYEEIIWWDFLRFEDNSETTMLEGVDLTQLGTQGKIELGNYAKLTGEGNNILRVSGYYSHFDLENGYFENLSIFHDIYVSFLRIKGSMNLNNTFYSNDNLGSLVTDESAEVKLYNNSVFQLKNRPYYYKIDDLVFSYGELTESKDYYNAFDNISLHCDNSTLEMDNFFIDFEELPTDVTNFGKVLIKNDVVLYSPISLSQNSSLEVTDNARFYALYRIDVSEGSSIAVKDNGIFSAGITMGENTAIKLFNSARYLDNVIAVNGCNVEIMEDAYFALEPGKNFTFKNGSSLILRDGSELVVSSNSVATFEKGSQIIIEGSAKITGNIADCYASIIINDNSKLTFGTGSNLTFTYNEANSVTGGINSEVVIESGAVLNFNPTTPCVMGTGSKITVQTSGKLYAYENSFSGSPVWNGIIAEVGSDVSLVSSRVKNAQNALSAFGAIVNISGSSFVDCYNGVSLTNCSGYRLNNNYFKGMNSGYDYGISLTECGGSITGNTVTNFGRGVILTLSSVNLIKNKINANKLSGVYVTGYNVPQMINTTGNIELNNEVKNNGDVQVLLIYHANVYLTDGYNNIYSDPIDVVPTVPCIYTAGWQISQNKALFSTVVSIKAERNYWGYSGVISDNFDSFFGVGINTLHEGYSLTYEPYAVEPFTALPSINPKFSSNEPPTAESNLLSVALMLEDKGNIKPSIKKYEQILSKYPDSPEAYVANARLPELYLQAERDVNELLMAYDEALESDVTTDKKFFKQMKITTNTKSAKYDEAIGIAEEMKAEAQNEAEVTLADLSIAIAETMKNNGKSNDRSGSNTISDLLAKLTGKGGEEQADEPSDITESVLPSQHELFQNYPNPFNPVTQINFALSKNADVKLSVYNINGQKVAELANGVMNAGSHAVSFDGSKLNSGVYYYTLETDGLAMTKKMILTK